MADVNFLRILYFWYWTVLGFSYSFLEWTQRNQVLMTRLVFGTLTAILLANTVFNPSGITKGVVLLGVIWIVIASVITFVVLKNSYRVTKQERLRFIRTMASCRRCLFKGKCQKRRIFRHLSFVWIVWIVGRVFGVRGLLLLSLPLVYLVVFGYAIILPITSFIGYWFRPQPPQPA